MIRCLIQFICPAILRRFYRLAKQGLRPASSLVSNRDSMEHIQGAFDNKKSE